MDRNCWRRVKSIFNQAVELPLTERKACVLRFSDGNSQIQEEVLALLQSHGLATDYLDNPPISLEPENTHLEGQHVGNYLISRRLGRGGMGAVYLATRSDGSYQQKVALKVLPEYREPSLVQRFHQERQILAQLEHPNIARLIDGGNLPDGHPYYVMEYVEGIRLDDYCSNNKLSIAKTLALFVQICEAVHFAHQNLIIHRDLKPGNILVTDKGEVKLLDFGVAKLLNTDNPDHLSDLTLAYQSLVTPSYASPEQVLQKAIGTASDVYTLGVLLYRLLTRQLPYQLHDDAPHTLTHAICEQQPRRPSELEGCNGLEGDLDNIILMALRKEPQRRYPSVDALKKDIQRYLDNFPVTATPDSVGYQVKKFVRRNRGAAIGASLILVLVIGFGINTYSQNKQINYQSKIAELERDAAIQARASAETEKATAEAAVTFMQEMLTSVAPDKAKGKEITVKEILDIASDKLNIQESLQDQPEVKSMLHHTFGYTYMKLGEYPLAEQHQLKAIELRQVDLGNEHPETLRSMNLLGVLYLRQGRLSETEQLWTQVLKIRQQTLGPEEPHTLISMSNLAVLHIHMDNDVAAEKMLKETLSIKRRVLGDTHANTLTIQNNLAGFYNEQGRYQESKELHLLTLNARIQTLGKNHPDTLQSQYNIAYLLSDQHEFKKSAEQFEQTLSVSKVVLGSTHPKTIRTQIMLANALAMSGDHQQAELLFEKSLAHLTQQDDPGNEDLVRVELYFGRMLLHNTHNRQEQAAQLIQTAWKNSHQDNKSHTLAIESTIALANLALYQGDYDRALQLSMAAETDSTQAQGFEHSETLAARRVRIETLLAIETSDQVRPLTAEWLAGCELFFGSKHPRTQYARTLQNAF